jgi:hypothetical protein
MELFSRIAAAVYREYDRRVKRASLITEYGVDHHTAHHANDYNDAEDDGTVAIMNVARGATVAQLPVSVEQPALQNFDLALDETPVAPEPVSISTPPDDDDDGAIEISNLPPGSKV